MVAQGVRRWWDPMAPGSHPIGALLGWLELAPGETGGPIMPRRGPTKGIAPTPAVRSGQGCRPLGITSPEPHWPRSFSWTWSPVASTIRFPPTYMAVW